MTTTTRRGFLRTSVAAVAGTALAGPELLAQSATLEITMQGLCVLVKTGNGIDLLLPAGPKHLQKLIDPTGKEEDIQGHSLSLSGLTSGAVALQGRVKCGGTDRWFADLTALNPGQALAKYPDSSTSRQISAFLRLSGGKIDHVVSPVADVPGINNIWNLVWGTRTSKQLLVEVAKYTTPVRAGTVTLTLTPMAGGADKTRPYTVNSGQKLALTIKNETATASPATRNTVGVLQHFNSHAGIFASPPPNLDNPESVASCGQPPPAPLIAPTKALIDALHEFHSLGQWSGGDKFQIGARVYFFTADDPICPIGYYEP